MSHEHLPKKLATAMLFFLNRKNTFAKVKKDSQHIDLLAELSSFTYMFDKAGKNA